MALTLTDHESAIRLCNIVLPDLVSRLPDCSSIVPSAVGSDTELGSISNQSRLLSNIRLLLSELFGPNASDWSVRLAELRVQVAVVQTAGLLYPTRPDHKSSSLHSPINQSHHDENKDHDFVSSSAPHDRVCHALEQISAAVTDCISELGLVSGARGTAAMTVASVHAGLLTAGLQCVQQHVADMLLLPFAYADNLVSKTTLLSYLYVFSIFCCPGAC
ncbi:unnamed protein product [Protopolystoma xenopodis]|uniref:Uncharacterized protein n=1 Tax=Protopolystoma xenopodis TaxID=117903 RepID=A0A3S5AAG2_9PLAT|nr:unnamed protein product [Protopolystoma xenopodis]